MTKQAKLLDRAWHALFHLDTREIAKHLPAAEVEKAYRKACREAELCRNAIEKALVDA